jgi:hypothetical protein
MSTCIRAGARYNRHIWEAGKCARCGKPQFENISDDAEGIGPLDIGFLEPVQSTEGQPLTELQAKQESEIQKSYDEAVQADLTDPNNKDSI